MRKIIIGASKRQTVFSKLIQWWINAPYSHVYVRWNLDKQDRSIVYHASESMVHFKSFDNFKKQSIIVKEIEIIISEEHFIKFSTKCVDLAGEPYAFTELLHIVLGDLTNNIVFKNQKGYICSELLAELLLDLGYKFNKPSNLVTPKDIIDTLENKNG